MQLRLVVLISFLFAVASAWKKVRDERLPGELRIVNEGLTHDDNYWYLTNKRVLYKTSAAPIQIEQANYHAIPEELTKLTYDHIGDIDHVDGIIYGGLEAKNGNGALAVWNATDLTYIRHRVTEQKDMPWVAVDPITRTLYSAVWNDCCSLQTYSMDTFEFKGALSLPEGVKLPPEIQGGAFYRGELYLATNENDAVWKFNLRSKELTLVLSDVYDHHEYEMEGITFWDLRSKGLGVMHLYGNFMQVREKCIRSYSPDGESV